MLKINCELFYKDRIIIYYGYHIFHYILQLDKIKICAKAVDSLKYDVKAINSHLDVIFYTPRIKRYYFPIAILYIK